MKGSRIVLLVAFWLGSFVWISTAAELIQREGKFIKLTTDLESPEECDALVATFDAAVPQWLKFWNLPERAVDSWKVNACVIRDKSRFKKNGLIPSSLPDFPFGYTKGDRVWVLAQQSEYYTRHLLLHEGAHALAFHHFQGAGTTWFMEGTAEMLATHSGVGKQVVINQIPTNRDAVPYWGRFKLMKQLRSENKVPSIETVMRYKSNLLGEVDAYGWSWAATMLFHAYPEYRKAFMSAARNGRDASSAFNRRFFLQLQSSWPVVHARWRLMCHDLDYGFDWSTEQVNISERDPVWNGSPITINVASNGSWQSAGVRIPPNTQLRLSASGRVTLASEPKPWISEPPGITYQYHGGRPLGQLAACLLPNAIDRSVTISPLVVQTISDSTTMMVPQFSWLLLRVNDSVESRGDNHGEFEVTIASQANGRAR